MNAARILFHNDTPFNCRIRIDAEHGMRFPDVPEEVHLTTEPPPWTWWSWIVEWFRLMRYGPRAIIATFECPVEVDVFVDLIPDTPETLRVSMEFFDDDLVWYEMQEGIWTLQVTTGQETNIWVKSRTLGAFDAQGRKTQMVHGRPMKPDTVRFTVTAESEDNETWTNTQNPVTNAKYNRNWNVARYCL